MTTFTDLSGATGADAPFTETVATALDRNLFAAFEGDSTAIAAGVRFANAAIADGGISGRALAGGFATTGSTQLFDFQKIKGSRTFNTSSSDQQTEESFIAKAGVYRIKLTATPIQQISSSSFKCRLLINGSVVGETAATSGTTTQVNDAVYTIAANSKVSIESFRVAGSSASVVNHSCMMQIYTNEIFSEPNRSMSWGYNYNTSARYPITFRTT
tara:strand:- start:1093 stop:1737 length:645 start_codon:yes stop_codon:yes gene_type:complete